MVRVAVLSCYRLLSVSLSQIVNNAENMEVVAVVNDWEQSIDLLAAESVHVVLMEVSMPSLDHFTVIRKLIKKKPQLKILVLFSQASELLPSQYVEAGAKGFLCRKASVEEVITAITCVSEGQQYFSRHYLNKLGVQQLANDANPFSLLSKRELQVLLLISGGTKVGSICDKLSLSPKTVNTYRYRIFNKLGIDNDVSLARWAIRQGLLEA